MFRRGYKEYKLSNFKVRIYDQMSFEEFCIRYKERLMKLDGVLKAINGPSFDVLQYLYNYYISHYPFCNIENRIEELEQSMDDIKFSLILSDIVNTNKDNIEQPE